MLAIKALAWQSFQSLKRGQVFLPACIAMGIFIIFAHIASTWSDGPFTKILFDVGLLGLHMIGSLLAIFWSVQVIAFSRFDTSIEFQLAGGISPAKWILARYLGLSLSLGLLFLFSLIFWQLTSFVYAYGWLSESQVLSIFLQALAWLVLSALSCCFSSFCGIQTALFSSFCCWIIGLSLPLASQSLSATKNPFLYEILLRAAKIFNLQHFNLSPTDIASLNILPWTLIYGFGLILVFLSLSCFIFSRKDLVL